MASPKVSRLVVVVVVAAISTLTSGQLLAAPAAAAAKAADGLSSESKQLKCSLFNKKIHFHFGHSCCLKSISRQQQM